MASLIDIIIFLSLSYVRSGRVYVDKEGLWVAGFHGFNWSNLAGSNMIGAMDFYITIPNVNPIDSDYRYNAFPVLSYVRSGYTNLSYGTLRGTGISVYGWSLLARPEANVAYDLYMDDRAVVPSNRDYFYFALPVIFMFRNFSLTW